MLENISISELTNLREKCAIVTGGAMGIGLAICQRLCEAGARVLMVDVNQKEGLEASDKLKQKGYDAQIYNCDVSCEEDVKGLVSYALKTLGKIDILVNNAGIYPKKELSEMTAADFNRVNSVNLLGTFLCCRYVSSEMIEAKNGGSIINISSIEALHPVSKGMSAYASSKGGVLMLTKSLAQELGSYEIRVNAIAPGSIKTPGVTSRSKQTDARMQLNELKTFLSRVPLERMGEADEVARVALFLASELSSYITGDMIVVDGGYLVS